MGQALKQQLPLVPAGHRLLLEAPLLLQQPLPQERHVLFVVLREHGQLPLLQSKLLCLDGHKLGREKLLLLLAALVFMRGAKRDLQLLLLLFLVVCDGTCIFCSDRVIILSQQ